jgi:hypothetical protein
VKKKDIQESEEIIENLSEKEKDQIESDVYDIIGVKKEEEVPVVLDLESIKIKKPGKFELDLVNLFNKKQPLVYKLDEGKYVIDIAESFMREKESKEQ